MLRLITLACTALFALSVRAEESKAAGEKLYREQVAPLLAARCVSCHGPELAEANLRLDSRAAALKGGDNGPAFVPGKPKDSLLLHAVHHARKELQMPPKQKLAPAEIALLEKWIAAGAAWPDIAAIKPNPTPKQSAPVKIGDAWSDPRNPIVTLFKGERLDLWSFKPIRRTEPPAVKDAAWPRSAIDRFLLEKLEAAKLAPAPPAEPRLLLRRLTFDLVGLPPTPEETAAFLADKSADAYEKAVDRLLASPRFGEHWARLWLDVVRYSDSNGFDWDEFRPQAWRYRDYVIRSLNADKPLDRFLREQLAGDELLAGPPQNEADRDVLLATGFLRLGPHDNAAPLFNEQNRARHELLCDLVETTGTAFLGLTYSCCRCHDHKHDPLSQADHYRLRAFFEPTKFADDLPIDLAPDQARIGAAQTAADAWVAALEKEVEVVLAPAKAKLAASQPAKTPPPKKDKKKKNEPSAKELREQLDAAGKEKLDGLEKAIASARAARPKFQSALLMTDAPGSPPPTRILQAGDHRLPKAEVVAGIPSALDPNPMSATTPPGAKTTGRRLALAEWIVGPQNPLTARVLVNRVWQNCFGRGLVATPDDFGLAGVRPTHPELLDRLASDFTANGWSLKRLVRSLVTSAAYRQGAATSKVAEDLYGGMRMRRLTAEQLRDAMLFAAGSLSNKASGPPIWPELPSEILVANPAFLDDNAEKTKGWYPSPAAEQKCRTIFLVQKRTVRVPLLEAFDLPENAVPCGRRNVSTVAPQALSLLNSPFAVGLAADFAGRVGKEAGTDPSRQIDRAYAIAFQRAPEPQERELCLKLLRSRSLPELCRAILNLNEFAYLD